MRYITLDLFSETLIRSSKAHCSFIARRANGKKKSLSEFHWPALLDFWLRTELLSVNCVKNPSRKCSQILVGECYALFTCRLPVRLTETIVQNIVGWNLNLESIFAACAFPNWFVFREPLLFYLSACTLSITSWSGTLPNAHTGTLNWVLDVG